MTEQALKDLVAWLNLLKLIAIIGLTLYLHHTLKIPHKRENLC